MVFLYMVPERRQMGGAAMEKRKAAGTAAFLCFEDADCTRPCVYGAVGAPPSYQRLNRSRSSSVRPAGLPKGIFLSCTTWV